MAYTQAAMDEPAAARTAKALAEAARAGPFFVVEPWTLADRWQPLRALIEDPAALSQRVGHARGVLASRAGIAVDEVEERVAASAVFFGLVSRLVSPQLGSAVLAGVAPDLTVADLWWWPTEDGGWRVAAGPASGTEVGDLTGEEQVRYAAGLIAERAGAIISPVIAAFAASFRLSRQVLRGNVASALARASAVLARSVPGRAEATHWLTAQILALGPLRGAGEFVRAGPDGGRPQSIRHSCCLLYRCRAREPAATACSRPADRASRSARAVASEGPYQVG